jgi:hypothetical protein
LNSHSFRHIPKTLLLAFILGSLSDANAAPVSLVDEAPSKISKPAPGVVLVDFGKVAFGNLKLAPPPAARGTIRIHFGEATDGRRINRKPPGSVRYASTDVALDGKSPWIVAPPADKRNSSGAAVPTPPAWGVVLPFRWVEIEGWPGEISPAQITRRAAYASDWDDKAASFKSSDETLNRIWELCRYSIKATTFAGVYVDGDRERIPYEADAYLNQLSHYATDNDVQMARDTFDHLMAHPTWPSEWGPHMIFMAHADWMHTGDSPWLASRYESLKKKMLEERVNAQGWVASNKRQQSWNDIVDWPQTERDGYEFREINTVVNAFHLMALKRMAELAAAVGKPTEAEDFSARFRKRLDRFNRELWMEARGAYRDGVGSDHASSHASLFPLAFGLVPQERVEAVCGHLVKRGMTCSVYAAQYLMEGLLQSGADTAALALVTAAGDRSWRHMLESGTTITWEAWDQKYKPNQDWNHAWGAAPANLFPRFLLGATPAEPGWKSARIAPITGGLKEAQGRIPTPRGPIEVHWVQDSSFHLKIELPEGMTARIEMPSNRPTDRVTKDGKVVATTRVGSRLVLNERVGGSSRITMENGAATSVR